MIISQPAIECLRIAKEDSVRRVGTAGRAARWPWRRTPREGTAGGDLARLRSGQVMTLQQSSPRH